MVKVTKVSKATRDVSLANAARVTAPAPGAVCPVWRCTEPPQGYREQLDPLLRPLCKRHRTLAQQERIKQQVSTQEAVETILRRAAAHADGEAAPEGARKVPEALRHELHTDEARDTTAALIDEQRAQIADLSRLLSLSVAREATLRDAQQSLRDESDRAFTELGELRAQLAHVRAQLAATEEHRDELIRARDHLVQRLAAETERVEQLEGQQLAEAVRPPTRPLARLAALAAVFVPDDRIAWTIGSTRAGDGQWCASALGHDDAAVSSWEAVAADPDEALAALVQHVEGVARAKVAALTAALGGA